MEPPHETNSPPEEFVTVVNVAGSQQQQQQQQPAEESFVTVLSIGSGKREPQAATTAAAVTNGIDPAHPEEEVEVYRLPGERLGFGLKFEGGNKTTERVRRLFIQSCAEQSPASRATCSWGNLGEGDEVGYCFFFAFWAISIPIFASITFLDEILTYGTLLFGLFSFFNILLSCTFFVTI